MRVRESRWTRHHYDSVHPARFFVDTFWEKMLRFFLRALGVSKLASRSKQPPKINSRDASGIDTFRCQIVVADWGWLNQANLW